MTKLNSLATGFYIFSATLGSAEQTGPQATEMVVPLETGGEVVFDMRNFGFETQAGIIDRLTACIEAGDVTRDECVGNVAQELESERLGIVVRETRAVLLPLEEAIGLRPEELIEEPAFCYAAPPEGVEPCAKAVENARLAGLDYRIAEVRAVRLEREAQAEANRERVTELAAQAEAGRERVAALEAEAAANRAVLAVLQQIAAEEAEQSTE